MYAGTSARGSRIRSRRGLSLGAFAGVAGGLALVAGCSGATSEETPSPTGSGAETSEAAEPIDLVFISYSSGGIVRDVYAELAEEALGREVRLVSSVDPDADAIRTRFADTIADAEIIVFYLPAVDFLSDMPEPNFDQACVVPVAVLDDPGFLDDPEYEGPEWTPGTPWPVELAMPTAEDWRPYSDALDGIWEAIWEVRGGEPVILRSYDVYNPWLGEWIEIGIESECTALWEGQARTVRETAEANGATFVSFYDVFNGPNHDEDARAKGWIGDDGMHANEVGATAAAEALAAVGFEPNEQPG